MATLIQPTQPATAWAVEVSVDDEHWGFLDVADGVCCEPTPSARQRWFDSPAEAEDAASRLRQEGWGGVRVVSNARY